MLPATFLVAVSLGASAQLRPSQPEPPSGWTAKAQLTAGKHVVVAAHPLAAEAGRRMLDKGGSAVDAAISTQLVLGFVEPHASGLGGGAFLLVHDAKAGRTLAYDGRETAPSGAKPRLFVGADGKPMPFRAAVVGVPGTSTEIEKGTELESVSAALKAMGHEVRAIDMTSGLAGIRRTAKGWEAGADPRREGAARGR